MSRHLMQSDPDAPPIRLTPFLWLIVVILFAVVMLAPPASPVKHKAACEKYPLIQGVIVCGNSVYLLKNGQRMYMGRLKDLQPMPKPHPLQESAGVIE